MSPLGSLVTISNSMNGNVYCLCITSTDALYNYENHCTKLSFCTDGLFSDFRICKLHECGKYTV